MTNACPPLTIFGRQPPRGVLAGDARQGRRPAFVDAAPPEVAKPLYDRFCALCRGRGVDVQEGVFRATMQVRIVNEGPVTLLLDSRKAF